MDLADDDYARLLAMRTRLRRFLHWSEQQARTAGLTAAQHQLLLAIRGHSGAKAPTVSELADYLFLRHHSAVGLVDRAESAGLVGRVRDLDDHRVVRLHLTRDGERRLRSLSAIHMAEMERLGLEGLSLPEEPVPPPSSAGRAGSRGS